MRVCGPPGTKPEGYSPKIVEDWTKLEDKAGPRPPILLDRADRGSATSRETDRRRRIPATQPDRR